MAETVVTRTHRGFKIYIAVLLTILVLLVGLLDGMLIYGAVKIKATDRQVTAANEALQNLNGNLDKLNNDLKQGQIKLGI